MLFSGGLTLHPKYRLTIPFLAPTRSSFRPPKAVSPLRGHREPCFFALFLVIAILSFRPFLGHCEPVFFALSPVIASLVCSSGEAISDCFASLATAKNAAGLLRFARSDAQKRVTARSSFRLRSNLTFLSRQESVTARSSCRLRSSLAFSASLVFTRTGTMRLLRHFVPRNGGKYVRRLSLRRYVPRSDRERNPCLLYTSPSPRD